MDPVVYELIRGIAVVLLWVGLWGIIEMIVDAFTKDDKIKKAFAYVGLVALGIIIIWLLKISI